jgi:RNA polymerase sigma factor (sigma-70 family)
MTDGSGKRLESGQLSADRGPPLSGATSVLHSAVPVSSNGDTRVSEVHNRLLEQWIALLPEDEQRVLQLRYAERKSFEVIGDLTGRTAQAARRVWLRAVLKLRSFARPPE